MWFLFSSAGNVQQYAANKHEQSPDVMWWLLGCVTFNNLSNRLLNIFKRVRLLRWYHLGMRMYLRFSNRIERPLCPTNKNKSENQQYVSNFAHNIMQAIA